MDVSGRGSSTRPGTQHVHGSDEGVCGNQCDQCKEDDLTVDADGYCEDCSDYLCADCIRQHRKLRGTKDHTVLTSPAMPKQKPQSSEGEKCSKHPDKPIELYCQSDETFGCVLCFVLGHKACKNVGLISELSKDIEISQELRDIRTAEQQHETSVSLYRKLIEEYHVINNTCYDKSIEDFESFRAEIEVLLDRLGKAVKTESGNLREVNKKKLDSVSERITSLDTEFVDLMSTINLKRKMKQNDQLFIAVKTNMKGIQDKLKKLQQLQTEIQIQRYVFDENQSIKQYIETMISTCIKKVLAGDITYIDEMNVKSPDDKGDCLINGIAVVSPTTLVLSDYVNQCVKMIDNNQNTTTTKRSLGSPPNDVTFIPESRVAVAISELKQLQLFTTDTGLEPCGHIAVDGRCISVVSTGDRLVVGYRDPPKVQIMDLNGQVLKSFTTDSSGNPLFGVPRGLCLSLDHTSIFISDWENNTVTRMSTEGTIEWVYRDKDLKFPVAVTTGSDGCLFICCRDTHILYVVSATGVKQTIVPVDQFNVMYPRAVCYSKDQGVLYVSSAGAEPAHRNFIRRLALQ